MERINIYVSQRVADEIEVFLSIFGTPEHKGMTGENMKECFGTDDMNRISSLGFDVMTEKYQEWKRRKAEIHIGDEVESVISHDTFVVTRIKNDTISGFDGTGTLSSCLKNSLRKTGRHFPEIAVLLMDIKDETKGRASAALKKPKDNFYGNDKTEKIYPSSRAKRGKWIICSDGYYPYCSECHHEPKDGNRGPVCPGCGIEMEPHPL